MAYLEIKKITKTFGKKGALVNALQGINLKIERGDMIAIMGKSGSGKSTLLNILGGLMRMDEGEIYLDGQILDFSNRRQLTLHRRKVGFVVQYFALIDEMTVYENIALPLYYKGIPKKQVNKLVMDVLKKLDIEDKASAFPESLSGGQQQRAAIARAVVKDPELILADEPTGALDEENEQEVMDIFFKLHKEGRTIIIVTHDMNIAEYCDKIVYLRDGKIAEL